MTAQWDWYPANLDGPPTPGVLTRLESVERSVPLDVRDYGVDITGATDSSVGMQAAIDAAVAADRPLHVVGTVMCGSLTAKSGLRMYGDPGQTSRLILPPDGFVGGIIGTGSAGVSADDCVFEDLVFDGQQQSRTISTANALLKAYKAKRWTVKRCVFKNSCNYGFGWQGYPTEPNVNKQDIEEDLYMEQCYFYDCGYIGGTLGVRHSGTNNSADNLDIKSVDRATLIGCYSTGSSDKGFNIRARSCTLIQCFADNNTYGFDLNSHHPSVAFPDNDSRFTVIGGGARGNIGTGSAFTATSGDADTNGELIGFHAIGNGTTGFTTNTPAVGGQLRVSIVGGKFLDNGAQGIDINGVQDLTITAAVVRGNGSDGIIVSDQDGGTIADCKVNGNTGTGIKSDGTSDKLAVHHNDVRSNGASLSLVGTKNRVHQNVQDDVAPNVASGASITLPADRGKSDGLVIVTGTSTIGDITRGYIGERVRLWFQSNCIVQHNNSSILLEGNTNFQATANDILELVCVNTNFWMQTSTTGVEDDDYIAPSTGHDTTIAAVMTANRAYYLRFVPKRNRLVRAISFILQVAASVNDEVCVGIYDASMNRIATSGAVTGKLNAGGVPVRQEVTLTSPVLLEAGNVYYAALSQGTIGGTAAQVLLVSTGSAGSSLRGATWGLAEVMIQGTAHPLPSTATPVFNTSSNPGVLLGVLE